MINDQLILERILAVLSRKNECKSGILNSFIIGIENLVDHKVKIIRCDNGTEFKNNEMNQFCKMKGILRQYSVARTPQQNGVAERRNWKLIEAARTMLDDSKLPTTFWAEAVNTACYVQNRLLVVKPHNRTLYELFHGRTPTLSFMRPFVCLVTILNTIDHLGKFDGKADEGFFVRYSLNSKAFRVFNSRTRIVKENLHIRFSENIPNVVGSGPDWLFDIDALTRTMNYKPIVAGTQSNSFAGTKASDNACQASKETEPIKNYILLPLWPADPSFSQIQRVLKMMDPNLQVMMKEVNVVHGKTSIELPDDPDMTALEDISIFDLSRDNEDVGAEAGMNNLDTTIQVSPIPTTRIHKDHPLNQVIRDLQSATQTRNMSKNLEEYEFVSTIQQRTNHKDLQNCLFACFLSQEEPKKVIHALKDPSWIEAMQEELLQFKLQEVWTLVDLPNGKRAIGTKWVFRNKKDERGIVIRNKARLVAQGYTQEEGIDYDEVFTSVARIEAIRLFLAYASFKDFVVYQMDVKSAFLYGKIEEEVYVCQPPGFEDPDFPDRVYKVEKALYGLHQAPRAWYETLSTYLLDNEFQRGKIDKTLFIKRYKGDILLVQVYVDDIIFGSTKKELCNAFEKLMHEKFQMSSMGELTFFLGLQVQQKKDGIFISQDKYVGEILKKFGFTEVKTASTPIETQKPLLKDEDGEEVDVHMYRSMIGSLMYLTSSRPDIMFAVCACARYQVNPKVSHLHAVKRIFRYLKGQPKLGLWYPKDSPFDLVAYTNSDYARASLDRKSTTGGCQFLRSRLISWQCKKQTVVANSTTEAEYVAASSCCGQVLWIQNQLLDYGYNFMHTKIFIDNNMDGKKIIITELIVRRDLQLEDAKGIDCLPNATIFEQLTLIGYEKISQKLTFYKAFFSPQWKFLIHTILQCLSSKTTAWNEFSRTMASVIICLATNQKFNFSKYIFESMVKNLDNVGKFLMYLRFVQVFVNQKLDGLPSHKRIYVTPSHTKKVVGNMKKVGKGFSGRVTPLFPTIVVHNQEEIGEGSVMPTDPHHTPTIIQPSTSQPQKTQKPRRLKRKDIEVPQPSGPTTNVADEAVNEEMDDSLVTAATTASSLEAEHDSGNIIKTQSKATPNEAGSQGTTLGGNILRSGEDSLKLNELMEFCTNLQTRVLNLETTKTTQANEIASLKRRVKKLEKKNQNSGEDASKHGRRITDINDDEDITLVNDQIDTDAEMFDVDTLTGDDVLAEQVVAAKDVNLSVDEVTLAQALAALKSAKV
ncbi:putative ribonuclease H-like domain-containing protein [Tanacetum coccineum]